MTDITNVYFCAECGSPAVDLPVLSGGAATCRACGWSGPHERLACAPIRQSIGGDADLLIRLVGDLRVVLAKESGTTLLKYLMKWGFVQGGDAAHVGKQLARYLAAIARAIVVAIIDEREALEKERINGN